MNVTLLSATGVGTGATVAACLNDISAHAPHPFTVIIAVATLLGQYISWRKAKILADAAKNKKSDKAD